MWAVLASEFLIKTAELGGLALHIALQGVCHIGVLRTVHMSEVRQHQCSYITGECSLHRKARDVAADRGVDDGLVIEGEQVAVLARCAVGRLPPVPDHAPEVGLPPVSVHNFSDCRVLGARPVDFDDVHGGQLMTLVQVNPVNVQFPSIADLTTSPRYSMTIESCGSAHLANKPQPWMPDCNQSAKSGAQCSSDPGRSASEQAGRQGLWVGQFSQPETQ